MAAGIGFTVALFVTGLAFDDPVYADQAKVGILAASVVAAVLAGITLRAAAARASASELAIEAAENAEVFEPLPSSSD
jgi:Na+/H+ antiporter NhaA